MKTLKRIINSLALIILLTMNSFAQQSSGLPVRLAIVGMSHDHIGFILGRPDKGDFTVVGIYEPDSNLAVKYTAKYKLNPKLIYSDLNKMLDEVKPEAAVAFGSIFDHLAMVEACAPRGIHMMVEKPLAVNSAHAEKMKLLAQKHHVLLLTDFEASWYPTTAKSFQMAGSNSLGQIRKVVIHDGHQGPKEIGCSKEFLAWLTDPVLNGGGAIIDFGCYGANLMTSLMKGKEPLSVTAVTRTFKPENYPKVDDEATIIVSYPDAQCIIEASWNWPFGRKDMEIYGSDGQIITVNANLMKIRDRKSDQEQIVNITDKHISVYTDPFSYFHDAIKGNANNDLYSLENNMIVVKILDAARESAKTGKTVIIK